MTKKISKFPLAAKLGVGLLVVAAGGLLGAFLSINIIFKPKEVDYKQYKEEDLVDDMDALLEKYRSVKNEYTIAQYAQEFDPWDLANIALFRLNQNETYYSICKGKVETPALDQTIRAFAIKNQNSNFLENISRSTLVKVATRFYSDNTIRIYKGKPNSVDSAKWEAEYSEYSQENFKETWGKSLSKPFSYIISSKTCNVGNKVEEVEDNYVIKLKLDKETSVINYVKEMVQLSNLDADPVFVDDIELNITINSDLQIVSTYCKENYKVKKPVWMDATGEIVTNYYYDNVPEIPDLETNCNYTEGK